MKHKFFLNPAGTIEIHIIGDVSVADMKHIGEELMTLITILEDKGEKANILVDLSEGGNTEALALKLSVIIAKDLSFHKIACYQTKYTAVLEKIIQLSGQEHKLWMFNNRSEAEAWLTEG